MNFNTVYNACMSKIASMEREGMYKSAAPTGHESAQVGRAYSDNEYAAQLANNAEEHYKKINPPPTGPKQPSITAQSVNLGRVKKYGPDRFAPTVANPRLGRYNSGSHTITQNELDAYRKQVVEDQATRLFDPGTNQHDAARQYLIERGKENQKRYNEGTLWKNEPSKVPMPKVISKPADVQALDHAGYTIASNNRRRNPNTGNA